MRGGSQERRLWNERPLCSPGSACRLLGSAGSVPQPQPGRVCRPTALGDLLVPRRQSAGTLERARPPRGEFSWLPGRPG